MYKIVNKVSELPVFDKDLPVFSDIETDDLYGPLRMVQFYQPQTSNQVYIVDIAPMGYDKDEYQLQLLCIENFIMAHYTVWYNSSYDLGCLNISPSMGIKHPEDVTEDVVYTDRVADLFYAVKTAYAEFQEFGLKKIVKKLRYTQGMYDGIDTEQSVKGFVRGAYVSTQAYKYGALDVIALAEMWRDSKIQNVINSNVSYKVDMMSQAYALIYQQNGLLLDRSLWETKLKFAESEVIKYSSLLPTGLNPNSYIQVRKLLGITKSAHEDLIAFKGSDSPLAPLAGYIVKLKKYKKQVSYLKNIEFDKMYTKFNVAGAVTGRFTSSGGCLEDHFNAQQIPRELQALFKQPIDGTKVIDLDYATLELRLACALYGVKEMYNQFQNDRDLHTEMAQTITGKIPPPVDHPDIGEKGMLPWGQEDPKYLNNKERNDSKSVNFGYVFGMSAKSYVGYAYTSYEVTVTLEKSLAIRNAYFKRYPELAKQHHHIWNNYKKPSFFVYTPLGRKIKPKLGTDGINIPVQGGGAETTKLGVHYMVKENPLCLKYIFNVVHDAIYLRTPDNMKEEYEDLTRRGMLKGWTEISKTKSFTWKDIKMEVE